MSALSTKNEFKPNEISECKFVFPTYIGTSATYINIIRIVFLIYIADSVIIVPVRKGKEQCK